LVLIVAGSRQSLLWGTTNGATNGTMAPMVRASHWNGDGLAATLLGLAATAETIVRAVRADASLPFGLVLVLLALGTTLPVFLLPPGAAAPTVAVSATLSLYPFQSLTAAGFFTVLAIQYRLGHQGRQRAAAALCVPFLVLALVLTDSGTGGTRLLAVLLTAFTPATAWAGAARTSHQEATANQAARQVIFSTLVEHTARGERARIARELHDVVAHHISMIVVQAENARLTTAGMPAVGAQRLSAISATARDALTEMRRLLGVLREDSRAEAADRHPQPGLPQLNELLDEARDITGIGARLILRGPPAELTPGVELAAFRIVQEALTNARRHAPGAAVDVELHYADCTLRVLIRDNGPGPPGLPTPDGLPAGVRTAGVPSADIPSINGHGLLGMRERALAVGGELRTGPASGGGFLVEARFPIKAAPA